MEKTQNPKCKGMGAGNTFVKPCAYWSPTILPSSKLRRTSLPPSFLFESSAHFGWWNASELNGSRGIWLRCYPKGCCLMYTGVEQGHDLEAIPEKDARQASHWTYVLAVWDHVGTSHRCGLRLPSKLESKPYLNTEEVGKAVDQRTRRYQTAPLPDYIAYPDLANQSQPNDKMGALKEKQDAMSVQKQKLHDSRQAIIGHKYV